MRKLINVMLILLLMISFVSCDSIKKRHLINDFESLVERVENHGSEFTSEQWDKVFEKYGKISDEMDKYNFSDEQEEKIANLKGRFVRACAAAGVDIATHAGIGIIKDLWEFLKGLSSGVSDHKSEIHDAVNTGINVATEAVDSLMGAVNQIAAE